MNDIFNSLIENFKFTSNLIKDSTNFLLKHNKVKIAEHSLRVANKAKILAVQYGIDENKAEIAGILHDIGGVYPIDRRVEISRILDIDILPEEEKLPLILHQKISMVLAEQVFNITSSEILSAIGCHTTLKSGASTLDKILFIADKLEWDQGGIPPYFNEVERPINTSLDLAVLTFLNYQFNNSKFVVIHPWLEEAYKELKNKVN